MLSLAFLFLLMSQSISEWMFKPIFFGKSDAMHVRGVRNRSFSGFASRANTRADFSRDFHSGILIKETKSPDSRRIDRFTGQQISTAEPCSARPELGSAGLFADG
jgi:hypothetical protein